MITISMEGDKIINLVNGTKAVSEKKWLDTINQTLNKEKDYEGMHLLSVLAKRVKGQDD